MLYQESPPVFLTKKKKHDPIFHTISDFKFSGNYIKIGKMLIDAPNALVQEQF